MFRSAALVLALLVAGAQAHLLSLEENQKLVNEGGQWIAQTNPLFAEQSVKELRQYLGALKRPFRQIKNYYKALKADTDKLPENFNVSSKWQECSAVIETIQDQSRCGSCWAVSTTSVLSDRLCIASNGTIQVSISALDLMACCNDCGYQCEGGYPDEAMLYAAKSGIVTGTGYVEDKGCKPYPIPPCVHNANGTRTCPPTRTKPYACQKKCQSTYKNESYVNDHYYGDQIDYFSSSDLRSIQHSLFNFGPVVAAFDVYHDFYDYHSGVYEHQYGAYIGGHAVRIVGWGTENGVDYWLVANSWGKIWGENGYFRIRRGTNECNFEEEIISTVVNVKRSLHNK